ncbi:MAG TPA: cytochrome P450 [Devosia sp.]|uniref:cytochrome P450 n=1 Tax=unclassified Sphingomonas TaxID=196159 RepID=UPI000DBBD207|nr:MULTISPECIES: cytochrome P450 [unclassified Sphingomonas]PZT90828.1 MAG: cytochrome P450 [Sphingomonas sp.]RSV29522.1 cytochrome P450 [Sphingomonas sp. ABOLH]HEV7291546.1 cytochrome P450 [Devosia sp.]
MTERFVPPYPKPARDRASLARRFVRSWHSWIHVLFEKSYTMKMGEIHLPALDFYIANEPSLVKRIMADPSIVFPKHHLLRRMLDPLIGNSLFSANGEDWRHQRAMVDPAFSHTAMGTVLPLMAAAVDALIARIARLDLTKAVEIEPLMTHVAADIIFRTLFSQPLGDGDAAVIHAAFTRYQRQAQSAALLRLYRLPTLGFQRRAEAAAGHIRAVFEPIVRARYDAVMRGGDAAAGDGDILQSLLAARHPETGQAFTFDEVMGQVGTIFLAGHETSASAMAWSLYLLAAAPCWQDAVRQEAAMAMEDGDIGPKTLRALPVTRNVFREALRLYPPVSFLLREVTCPTRMRDKDMPTGAMLVVSPWLVQRNSDHWPDPHAFDPGRFDRAEAREACRDAYFPFGRGPRTCVGAGFAHQEGALVLARMVTAFGLAPVAGDAPEPVSRLTLRSRRGIRLRLARIRALPM